MAARLAEVEWSGPDLAGWWIALGNSSGLQPMQFATMVELNSNANRERQNSNLPISSVVHYAASKQTKIFPCLQWPTSILDVDVMFEACIPKKMEL